MSDYAVVLQKDNMVVMASLLGGVDNIGFTKDGKVSDFIYQGVKYISIYVFSTKQFIEYADATKFSDLITREKKAVGAKYSGIKSDLWNNKSNPDLNIAFKFYQDIKPTQPIVSNIYGVLRDETGLCFYYYTWDGDNPYKAPVNPVPAYNPPKKAKYECDVFSDNVAAQSFYNNFKDRALYDLSTNESKTDIRLVAEIASLVKTVDKQMLLAFNNFTVNVKNEDGSIGEFKFFDDVSNSFYREDLLYYRDGLKRWLEIYAESQDKLAQLKDPEKLYILCDLLYRYNMLTLLSVDQKISLLKTFCGGVLIDWYFSFSQSNYQNRESLVVRVIKSVTETQAADFLAKLISTTLSVYRSTTSKAMSTGTVTGGYQDTSPINKYEDRCLYRILFKKIDDYWGKENFTQFIQKLESLVLSKHNVTESDKTITTKDELDSKLKHKTAAQFIWCAIRNENKVNYTVVKRTNEQITFNENICKEIASVEIQQTTSLGVPTNSSYTITKCISDENNKITVGHFDLVSIHFYENPSFIDLGSAIQYKEDHFYTFAGFVDYLIEKENTKIVEEIIVAGLTALSIAFGFGEVIAAIRTANIARLLLGIGMVAADVTTYLPQNSAFRNYIINKYPQDYDKIFTVMTAGGAVLTLGSVGIAGSGMLKTFSASEAAEFVGIGRQVLADADAVALLSANDLKILKNGINIYENGLYRIKYDIEIAKDVNRAKSIIKYFDNEVLRTEIFALDEVNKLRFLDDFGTASDLFKVGLTDHPEYVNIWSNYSEEQKLLAKTDPVQSLKSELQNIRFHRKYVWIEGGLPPIPTPEEVLANYGSKELALYNNVEELVIAIRSGIQKSSFGDFVLISGMVDTESGMYSELFSNFLKDEYYTNYINFLSNQGPGANLANEYLQPNMAEILGIAKIKKEAGEYVFENPELVSNTGNRIGSHAEFRALNNLAAKKFGNIKIDEIEFDHWLTKVVGYNSYIRRAGCQQPCADCFYLTALIKYIKK